MATIKEALRYSFSRWGRTFNYYWALIPIWGWFVVYGYIIRVLNEIKKGNKELPPINPFKGLFKTGALFFVVMLVIALASLVLIFIPVVGWLALIYLSFMLPMMMLQFAEKQEIKEGLNFIRASKTVFNDFKRYGKVMLKALAVYLPFIAPYYILFFMLSVSSSPVLRVLFGSLMGGVILVYLVLGPAIVFSMMYLLGDYWKESSLKKSKGRKR